MNWLNLDKQVFQVWSQDGEEGILLAILARLAHFQPLIYEAVDIGAGDGYNLSNTRLLASLGWRVWMMDARSPTSPGVDRCFVTAENVNSVLDTRGVPNEFGVLSLDIDGNDYWVWNALVRRPSVVCIEFNGALPAGERLTIPYDPDFKYQGDAYYGASFEAMRALGRAKGYTLVYQQHEVNLFFVRSDLLPSGVEPEVPFEPRHYHKPAPEGAVWVKV